jgi:hypothetical protein
MIDAERNLRGEMRVLGTDELTNVVGGCCCGCPPPSKGGCGAEIQVVKIPTKIGPDVYDNSAAKRAYILCD